MNPDNPSGNVPADDKSGDKGGKGGKAPTTIIPKSGDETNVAFWLVLALAALAAFAYANARRRKQGR